MAYNRALQLRSQSWLVRAVERGRFRCPKMAARHFIQRLFLLFAVVFGATASGQPPEKFAKVAPGGVVLSVPPINGFRFPTEQESGNIYAAIAPFVLPKNRLLTVLLTDSDIRLISSGREPKLNSYFVLQVPRSTEGRVVTLGEFQSLRRGIREQQASAQLEISPNVKLQLAEASRVTTQRTGAKIRIEVSSPIPMGVFEDTERSIGATFLSKWRAESGGTHSDDLMLSASVATIVRGKLLYLNGSCTFRSIEDVSTCNNLVKDWLSALHHSNP